MGYHRHCPKFVVVVVGAAAVLYFLPRTFSFSSSQLTTTTLLPPPPPPPEQQQQAHLLAGGSWIETKTDLRRDDCCVVSVSGLDESLQVLKNYFVDNGPMDIDLRARIHVESSLMEDCLKIRQSVVSVEGYDNHKKSAEEEAIQRRINSNNNMGDGDFDRCTLALSELARGVSLLAEDGYHHHHLEEERVLCKDVFIRIVCASDYKAIDPMYHTDKAPLRGYVTLVGPGTEFMQRTASPLEYASLRTLGQGVPLGTIRQARPLEFIVMKGDHYIYEGGGGSDTNKNNSNHINTAAIMKKLWTRASACVHRSPSGFGGRRVIVSFDLADGDDDREWYQKGKKREWRAGMTQRKSRFVA